MGLEIQAHMPLGNKTSIFVRKGNESLNSLEGCSMLGMTNSVFFFRIGRRFVCEKGMLGSEEEQLVLKRFLFCCFIK